MKNINVSSTEREEICKNCPIYKDGICNPKLFLNPDTNDVSARLKPGYIKGCGCNLKFKWGNPNNHCIAGKW